MREKGIGEVVLTDTRRRTQAERSALTKNRVLKAAIASIERMGLQHASTHDISAEAGVSRGAMLHHFSTRTSLLKAAFGMLLDQEVEELRRYSKTVATDGSSLPSIISYIWERYQGRLFMVTVDYLSLARVDSDTLDAVSEEAARFNDNLNAVWDKCLKQVDLADDDKRRMMNQTMALIRGLALQRIWRNEDAYFLGLLNDWIRHLEARVAATAA